jgi:hypothetical protein
LLLTLVSPPDPLSLAAACLSTIGSATALIPSRRAARFGLMFTLREERVEGLQN